MKHRFFQALIVISLIFSQAWAADFPPRDKGPLTQVPEKKEGQPAADKESVTPQSVPKNTSAEYALAEVHITVLSGENQKGEKSYKADYRVVEVEKGAGLKKADPALHISYKKKADRDLFTVSKVEIRRSKTNPNIYKITAQIDGAVTGENKAPEIIFLD